MKGKLFGLETLVAILVIMSVLVLPACSQPPAATPTTTATSTAAPTATSKPAATTPSPAAKSFKIKSMASPTTSSLYAYDLKQGELLSSKIPGLQIAVLAGGTIQQSMEDLTKNDIQMGFAGPQYLYRGTKGILDQKTTWLKDIRILWLYSSSPITIFVTQDSGVKTLADLNGKKFGYDKGAEASFYAGILIELAGAQPDYLYGSSASIETAISNRQCIGFDMPGAPTAMAQRVQATNPITILPVPQEILNKAVEKYGGRMFVADVIPAKTYDGQDKEIQTVQNPLVYVTSKDTDPEIVYQMAKVAYENRNELAKADPRANMITNWPQATIDAAATPLHAGIVKFLQQDLKLKVPAEIIPPEFK
jgi:TRAP transporter TAXI family solute receptor